MYKRFKKWLFKEELELLDFYGFCIRGMSQEVNALRLKNKELSNDLLDADEYIDELEQDIKDYADHFEKRIAEINEDAERLIEQARAKNKKKK